MTYKRDKGRYIDIIDSDSDIILLQPELGEAATKSLCSPASLVLADGTAVWLCQGCKFTSNPRFFVIIGPFLTKFLSERMQGCG